MYDQLANFILGKTAIAEPDMQVVLSLFKPVEFSKNEILLDEGKTAKNFFFVVKGCLRLYSLQPNGSEATGYVVFENMFMAGLYGFITQEPTYERIQALEDTTLLCISRENFYYLLDQVPGWEKFYRSLLEFAYVVKSQRLFSFLALDATERYQLLLKENPQVAERLSNKMVANYLGISQEALSRLKGKLKST